MDKLLKKTSNVLLAFFLLPFTLTATFLQKEVDRELDLIDLPLWDLLDPWDEGQKLDVAIIGGGQAGLSLCFALFKQGVYNVQVFDQSIKGQEGPWLTVARMPHLRTSKWLPGPALDLPSLTFRSWYEAKGSFEDWDSLFKVPTSLWGEYLQWYREVLRLPVHNEWHLNSMSYEDEAFILSFNNKKKIRAKKVVLATGIEGFGGFETPQFLSHLPKKYWSHTGERLDKSLLIDQKILVVGAGASAFDTAAFALENGAKHVTMIMRKKELPEESRFALIDYWPGFYHLTDQQKVYFISEGLKESVGPAPESVEKLKTFSAFKFSPQTTLRKIRIENRLIAELEVANKYDELEIDYIIAATGYKIDIEKVKELAHFKNDILLWKDKGFITKEIMHYPYIGKNFQFIEKSENSAPYLKDLYCFNLAGFVNHGFMLGSVPGLPYAANQLAESIASDFFIEQFQELFLKAIDVSDAE